MLSGFELRFDENANDYLVYYGMTPEQCMYYEKIFLSRQKYKISGLRFEKRSLHLGRKPQINRLSDIL